MKIQIFNIDKKRKVLDYFILIVIFWILFMVYRKVIGNMGDIQGGLFSLIMMALVYLVIVYPFFLDLDLVIITSIMTALLLVALSFTICNGTINSISKFNLIITSSFFIIFAIQVVFSVLKIAEMKKISVLYLIYYLVFIIGFVAEIVFLYSCIYFNISNNLADSFMYIGEYVKLDLVKSVYFSACTIFTVGFGDIHPVDKTATIATTTEIIIGYILSVVFLPSLISLFNNYISNSKVK